MPLTKNSAIINAGLPDQFLLSETIIPNYSYIYFFSNFTEEMDIDDARPFVEESVRNLVEMFATQGFHYKIKVNVGGTYLHQDAQTENDTKFFVVDGDFTKIKTLADYDNNFIDITLKTVSPAEYAIAKNSEEIGLSDGGSKAYIKLIRLKHLKVTFIKVHNYNANELTMKCSLIPSKVNRYITFVPINNDSLCILHCIYVKIKNITITKAFTKVDRYLEDFNQWVDQHNLFDLYDAQWNFDLRNIQKLEDRLEVNINIYTKDRDSIALEYRSKYMYETIIPILLVSYSEFQDYDHKVIFDKTSVKNYIPFVSKTLYASNSHAVLFKKTALNLGSSSKSNSDVICEFCDKHTKKDSSHHEICRNYFKSSANLEERLYDFKPAKVDASFSRFEALLRLPFVSYDFETRIDQETLQSVLLSYSLCFVNIFDLKQSIYLSNASYNVQEINALLIADIIFLSRHYYGLQGKDEHDNKKKFYGKECPVCYKTGKYEFNHSHFFDDHVNKAFDCFMCDKCNKKLQVKNKPLQFYAFNAKNYDNTFLLNALTSSDIFEAHHYNFMAKSASKFTSIRLNIPRENHSSIEFKDAILHFPGNSLDSATRAILKKEQHFDLLKIMLEKQYGNTKLYSLSKVKAPFPYDMLNEDNFNVEGNFTKEKYYNTLSNSPISDKDYALTNTVYSSLGLQTTFKEYHDFYLLLDTVLLACLLYTYMNDSYKETKINPLAYISSSSHAYGTFLYTNHFNRNKMSLTIPPAPIQLELKRAIRGGFTQVFNKKNDQSENSITTFMDATSLYPTQFRNYLPIKYIDEVPVTDFRRIMDTDLDKGQFWYLMIVDIKPLAEKYQKRVRNYPLFPGPVKVEEKWLSKDQVERYKYNSNEKTYKPQYKNTVTFFEKKDCYTSARYLKNAMDCGYEVSKVTKIYKFEQKPIMKDFVDQYYTMKRNASMEIKRLTKEGGDHEEEIANLTIVKNLAKVLLNACYGSTIVNSLKFTEVKMLSNNDEEQIQKQASSFHFKDMLVTDRNTFIHSSLKKNTLNYPLMLGVAILDDSKIQMSKYVMNFYDFITSKGLELLSCYVDTDSYISSVIQKGKVVFQNKMEMFKQFNEFYNCIDMSWYSGEYYSNKNEEQLGMFTDETESENVIEKCVFLCAKVYAIKSENFSKLRSKGISKTHAKKLCNFELYESIVDGTYNQEEKLTFEMKKIQNQNLEVKVINLKKQYITYVDIKNYYGTNSPNYLIFGEKAHLEKINF